MHADDLEHFREQLLIKRDEIVAASDSDRAAASPVILDQQSVGRLSRMDAMQIQAMAKDTERRRQIQLQRIELALKRIDEHCYGDCLGCDEPVARGRLEFDPATPLCISCANAADS